MQAILLKPLNGSVAKETFILWPKMIHYIVTANVAKLFYTVLQTLFYSTVSVVPGILLIIAVNMLRYLEFKSPLMLEYMPVAILSALSAYHITNFYPYIDLYWNECCKHKKWYCDTVIKENGGAKRYVVTLKTMDAFPGNYTTNIIFTLMMNICIFLSLTTVN